jgi:hypothetical protein
MRHGLRPVLAAGLLTCAAGASAQTFSGVGAAPVLTLPSPERAPVAAPAAPPPTAAGAADPVRPSGGCRRSPNPCGSGARTAA